MSLLYRSESIHKCHTPHSGPSAGRKAGPMVPLHSRFKPIPRRRHRGMVAIQVALCLVPLCGVAAFSIDCGMMMEYRRRVQATADAAALAAAADLYVNSATNNGLDAGGTAASSASLTASTNGFSSDSTLTVNIPPQSGPFTGKSGYAEVILVYQMTRGFSSILGSGTIPIQARSVARGLGYGSGAGVILLDPTGQSSLTESGSASIDVGTASVIVDSNNSKAVTLSGSAGVTASKINITGNYSSSSSVGFNGTVTTGASPTSDPLASIAAPSMSSLTTQSSTQYKLSSGTATLNPGVYTGGISLSSSSSATLNPGIYYLNGGGLTISGSASITGSGVMFYNAPGGGNGKINISGTGSITLSPPTSGAYKGISLFQDRTLTNGITISGGSGMNMSGTFYAAKALMNISGSASNSLIGSQYISYDLSISGSGSVKISYSSETTASQRMLGLVE